MQLAVELKLVGFAQERKFISEIFEIVLDGIFVYDTVVQIGALPPLVFVHSQFCQNPSTFRVLLIARRDHQGMQTLSICLTRIKSLLDPRSINPLQVLAGLFQIQLLEVCIYLLIDILMDFLIIWTRRFTDSFHLMFFVLPSDSRQVLG